MAQSGVPIRFSLVQSGIMPAVAQQHTVYFVPSAKQLYVGNQLVADSINVPEEVERYLSENNIAKLLSNTKENWNSNPGLISELGCIYIYSNQYEKDGISYPGMKIGDGKAYLIDIPFVESHLETLVNDHINDTSIHINNQERSTWNSHVTTFVSSEDQENLVFMY